MVGNDETITQLNIPQVKKKLPPLGNDLLKILNKQEYSDITLCFAGEKRVYTHKVVLSSRSKFFEAMFAHEYKESEGEIKLHDIPYELFMNLLEFMYSDQINLNLRLMFDLLALADWFGVQSFKEKSDILLTTYISVNTVCYIFKYANEYNLAWLKETCLVYMEENYDEVIYSPGFEELDKDEMLKIIRLCKKDKNGKAKFPIRP